MAKCVPNWLPGQNSTKMCPGGPEAPRPLTFWWYFGLAGNFAGKMAISLFSADGTFRIGQKRVAECIAKLSIVACVLQARVRRHEHDVRDGFVP